MKGMRIAAVIIAAAAMAAVADRMIRRPADELEIAAGEELRDAVASAPGAASAARVSLGRAMPVSPFAGPSARHAEIERVLMSSRRRRGIQKD